MKSHAGPLLMLLAAAMPAMAKEKASFIDGVYSSADGCLKLARIEAGGPRNVETVPWTLDADGFHGWEGSCEFTRVLEHEPGKEWVAIMVCVEGAQFVPDLYLFMRGETDDELEVAHQGSDVPDVYRRCKSEKGR